MISDLKTGRVTGKQSPHWYHLDDYNPTQHPHRGLFTWNLWKQQLYEGNTNLRNQQKAL